MEKLVLEISQGDDKKVLSYKTFEYESKEAALLGLELIFDSQVNKIKEYDKIIKELETRYYSMKSQAEREAVVVEINRLEKENSNRYQLVMNQFKFHLNEIALFNQKTNQWEFNPDLKTLQEWFEQKLANK